MKKSIEKLFKNGIFRKITVGVMFVLACCFACFFYFNNHKVAAANTTFTVGFGEYAYWPGQNYGQDRIYKAYYKTGEEGTEAEMSSGTAYNFDTTKKLYIRVQFNDIPSQPIISKDDVCLFYKNDSDYTKNAVAKAYECVYYANGSLAICNFCFEPGTFPPSSDDINYEMHILPKSYSFHTGNFRLSGGGTKNAYDFLDIKYQLDNEGNFKSFPSYQVANSPQESIAGTYYDTLLFDLPRSIKLDITGKNGFDISNLKYSDNKDLSVEGTLWSSDDNPFTHGGYSVAGSVNIYFDEIKASLSLESLDEGISLADKVALSYSLDGGSTYTNFGVTPNTNNYASVSGITLGKTIYIKATSKTGYNIDNLKYKFNNGIETAWPEDGVNFVINGDSTLKIGGIEEKKVTINPNYRNGTGFDAAYLYNALEIKYRVGNSGNYADWETTTTDGITTYKPLEVQEGSNISLQVTIKSGYKASYSNGFYINYKFYDNADGYNGATTNRLNINNATGNINLQANKDKYLTFSDIEIEKVKLNPNYASGSNFDPEYLYKALELKYKKEQNGSYEDWPTDAAESTSATKYVALPDIQKGTKVYVRVIAKRGYDISSLGYKFYTGDTLPAGNQTPWPTSGSPASGEKDFTMDNNRNLVFSGIKFRKVNAHFVATGLDEGIEQSEVLNVYKSSQTPSDLQEMDAHQKYRFRLSFSNCNSSMKTGFNIENIKVFSNEHDVTTQFNFENAEWDEDPNPNPNNLISFSFDATADTDLSEVDFRISGIVLKNMNVKFVRDDDKFINVGKFPSFEDIAAWGTEGEIVASDICQYAGEYSFVLKPRAGGSWSSGSLRWDQLIDAGESITDEQVSCELVLDGAEENSAKYYKITIKGIKNDLGIKLKSGVVKFRVINISFANIRLPNNGHNEINVSQDGAEVLYPDRGNDMYTLRARILPSTPEATIKIELPSIENYKFVNQDGNRDFIFYKGTSNESCVKGTVSEDGRVIDFLIPNGGDNDIIGSLSTGDIDIDCNCLIPEKKKISFALNGGVTATVSDVDRGILPVSSTDGEVSEKVVSEDKHFVNAEYGDLINITYNLNVGHFLDNPEEQITIYKVLKNEDDSERLEALNYDTDWNIDVINGRNTIIFNDILQLEIKVVFNCDKDNIPIDFKSIEGLSYYSVNMKKDTEGNVMDAIDESNPFVIKDTSTNEKQTIKGIITVETGSNCYFAVGVDAGYDVNSLKVTQNGNGPENTSDAGEQDGTATYSFIECKFTEAEAPEGYRFYKLIKVQSNITVSGTVSKKTLNIEFKNEAKVDNTSETAKVEYKRDGVNIGTSLGITYGNAAAFTVNLPEDKYNQSDFKVWVRGKNQEEKYATEVTKYQNEYRILDIDEDKIVYVTNVTVNRYVLNFVANDKSEYLFDDRSFSGTRYADHGSYFEFKVKAKQGYKLDNVKVNYHGKMDRELTPTHSSGSGENVIYTFKISNIQENSTITVDKVSNITYKVTFQDVPGATYLNDKNSVISGKVTVGYGKNFEFGVNIDDSYDDSAAGMFIVLNDGKTKLSAQKLSSGRYMIPNITEDVKIRVGNIRKNTYTVTLRNEEGIDYYNSSDKIVTGDNTVEHGGSLSFRVSLYPAYSDSDITVMLGNDKMTPDSSGYYHISGVVENKIVTVTGIHANSEVDLINTINNLPQSVNDLNDVNSIIEASKWYNSLTDAQKANVSNADVLKNLQQQAGAVLHRSNDVIIDGPEWYVKLVVVPISSDMDACARIYKKLNSEYILSLYDIYLWDTLNDVRYIPGVDEMYTVTIPTPKLTNFRNPTGVHEDSNTGKVSFMDLVFNGDTVSFQTNSFSPMGVVASHDAMGASSLFDAAGARLDWINDYVLGSASRGPAERDSSDGTLFDNGDDDATQNDDESIGNINDKFRGINNRVTPQGSALRLILVLLILILIALAIWIIYKKRKENGKDD